MKIKDKFKQYLEYYDGDIDSIHTFAFDISALAHNEKLEPCKGYRPSPLGVECENQFLNDDFYFHDELFHQDIKKLVKFTDKMLYKLNKRTDKNERN